MALVEKSLPTEYPVTIVTKCKACDWDLTLKNVVRGHCPRCGRYVQVWDNKEMAKGLSITNVRTSAYAFSKFLGDVNALSKGTVVPRIARRIVGKQTGKALRIFGW